MKQDTFTKKVIQTAWALNAGNTEETTKRFTALAWDNQELYNKVVKTSSVQHFDDEDEASDYATGFVKDDFAWAVVVVDNIKQDIVHYAEGSDYGRTN